MYLDWEDKDAYVIDIETDSLTPTVIWVMCWKNVKTGEIGECTSKKDIVDFFGRNSSAIFIGHNILKFDAPVLARLMGIKIDATNCIDTLILSQLYSPNISGGHSLGAWGEKLGRSKIDFDDWSGLTTEMTDYCHMDVEITTELFVRLMKTLARIGFTEMSIYIQHRSTLLIDEQRKNGFMFDGQRAIYLYQTIRSKEEGLQDEIRKAFPAERVHVASRRMFRKDGTDTAIYERDKQRYVLEQDHTDGSYEAYEDVEFNIGSPNQRVQKLLALGWEPEEFTPVTKKGGGGNPQPFDKGDLSPSLARFLEKNPTPEVKLITKWMSYNGRANMINNWLENWNEDTGCIHGKLNVADTLRWKHSAPNTANIPAVRVDKDKNVIRGEQGYYTYEARDLWVAREGRVLVGTDAAGLELRMLAHFLDRPEFTKQVVDGDPHQYNADTVGVTRAQAKTLIYAILYGAAAPKIANTLGISVREGASIRMMFLERLGLKGLIDECQREQREGRVSLVDGSWVVCPSPHSALNYKLQGSGARVMSLGGIILGKAILRMGLDSLKVGDIHDEWQYDVLPPHADDHAHQSIRAIRNAGERLRLKVPLDAEAKKGLTWAETH